MTAEEAVTAHRAWKTRLRVAMAKREILDLQKVASDQCCEFGKWLHTDALKQFGGSLAYADCLSAHQNFHHAAAKVAAKINEGELLQADQMMASGTEFAKISGILNIKVRALLNSAPC
jgi:hypothetical protein